MHIAFTGYRTRVEKFTNADLANASIRELLRLVFTDPEQLRPVERQETITELAAGRLAQIAQFLEKRGYPPSQVAPFFMKVLFALFAEDIKLLPAELMSQSIKQAVFRPGEFTGRVRSLFRAMAHWWPRPAARGAFGSTTPRAAPSCGRSVAGVIGVLSLRPMDGR